MRRADHLHKTMTALRCCVEQCRRDPAPLAALEKNLHELRQNADFAPADIAEIESLARRALAACQPLAGMPAGGSTANADGAPCV